MEHQGNIQVIAYREFFIDGKPKLKQELRANVSDSVSLFSKIDTILNAMEDNWNIHYTLAYCANVDKDKGIPLRTFLSQDLVPIDLDGIELEKKEEYITIVLDVLQSEKNKTGIFCSGNGLHFIIKMDTRITSVDKFKALSSSYHALCGEINQRIFDAGLLGHADTQRWTLSATLRLPNTENRKEDNVTQAYTIQGNVEAQDFDLAVYAPTDHEPEVYRAVDSPAVLNGCEFLRWCVHNQKDVKEPQWYAMIGILAYIPEIGKALCHQYSSEHPDYDHETTEAKYNQARDLGKPRICESVAKVFDCRTCTNYGKCKTPLQIKSDDFIATKDTGFHTQIIKDGVVKGYKPHYDDLYKFMLQQLDYIYDTESDSMFVWTGKYWKDESWLTVDAFSTKHFIPLANNTLRNEFKGLVKSRNHVSSDFFEEKTEGMINFNNGILRIHDRKMLPHSKTIGFQYVLPYDYDGKAECPEFDRLMDDVTMQDESLKQILLEYMGYCISSMPASWGQKALILEGPGGTGKSTFLDILRAMVGDQSYSSVNLEDFDKPHMTSQMVGKLFNACEEVKFDALRDSTHFKNISTGGTITVKKLYKNTYTTKINAKLICSCNEIPPTNDRTNATYRRMLLVPFRNEFYKQEDEAAVDRNVAKRIAANEMGGVYNRVLSALDVLIKQNAFSKSVTADKILAEYKDANDIVRSFCSEHIESTQDDDMFTLSTSIFKEWREWCRENNIKDTYNSMAFGKRFSKAFNKASCIKSIKGINYRGYKGIRIIHSNLGGKY